MFGNRLLPNIAPSFLCFQPPPTHIPPPPPSPLPLANARTGHVRARSSATAACAPPLVEGCGQTTRHVTARVPLPRRSLPMDRHVTAEGARIRHVTAANDPYPPPHHPKPARTPRHGRRRPIPATSAPKTSSYATSRMKSTGSSETSRERELGGASNMGKGARTQGTGG